MLKCSKLDNFAFFNWSIFSFTFTLLSPLLKVRLNVLLFIELLHKGGFSRWLMVMKKRATVLAIENELPIDLTLHDFSASLIAEFANKIVKSYYGDNLNAALQDLIRKALAEQDFVLSHITQVRTSVEA
jgi:hypothetical protein